MFKWGTLFLLLFLLGCMFENPDDSTLEQTYEEDVEVEVAATVDQVESLLTEVELAVGLGHFDEATQLFGELSELIKTYDLTPWQTARFNTMSGLLVDAPAGEVEFLAFSGSEAAILVKELHGGPEDGYRFVYHQFPSFVGTSGLGFYVFLVRDDEAGYEPEVVQTFFATDGGQVLTFD